MDCVLSHPSLVGARHRNEEDDNLVARPKFSSGYLETERGNLNIDSDFVE